MALPISKLRPGQKAFTNIAHATRRHSASNHPASDAERTGPPSGKLAYKYSVGAFGNHDLDVFTVA
jgi:hypothetical protein